MDLTDVKYLLRHCVEMVTQSKSSKENDVWYYFIHIPKTAGTSVRYMLYNQFRASEIYPNNVDYYLYNRGRYVSLKDFKVNSEKYITKKTKLLMGHFRMFPINNCKERTPKTFAFFRDPTYRIVSSINYHKEKGKRYERYTKEEILLMIEKKESQQMAKTFGYDSKKNNIAETLDRISGLDAIGITEYMDLSIQNINKTFGWKLSDINHRNKSKNRKDRDASIIEKINSLDMVDAIVYKHALKVFVDQCKVNGIFVNH